MTSSPGAKLNQSIGPEKNEKLPAPFQGRSKSALNDNMVQFDLSKVPGVGGFPAVSLSQPIMQVRVLLLMGEPS